MSRTSADRVRGLFRGGWWRFISCPSTLKTADLSWLALPYKWWSSLTDLKEPLRITSSLAVSLSVPTATFHIHTGHCGTMAMAHHFRSRGFRCRSQLLQCGAVPLGKAPYLHVHSLDPRVNGYLVGQWLLVCLNIVSSAVMAAGAACSQGVQLVLEQTGPMTREKT